MLCERMHEVGACALSIARRRRDRQRAADITTKGGVEGEGHMGILSIADICGCR